MKHGHLAVFTLALIVVSTAISIPLVLRHRREALRRHTQEQLKSIEEICRAYRAAHGHLPRDLAAAGIADGRQLDAWKRPVQYGSIWKYSLPQQYCGIEFCGTYWSLGPDANDASDDIYPFDPPSESAVSLSRHPVAPASIGCSKMD